MEIVWENKQILPQIEKNQRQMHDRPGNFESRVHVQVYCVVPSYVLW